MTQDSLISVSVIVPTRNRSHMLQDTLSALAAQTFPPDRFEVFIMDNLSTDDTEAVVKNFAATVSFTVHYHRMERDGGPVPARNQGARLARGEVLAFTDSDCRPCPEWIERGFDAFEPGVSLVTGPVTYKPEQQGDFFAKRSAETLVEHASYPTANAFYRRSTFLEFSGFDANLCFRDPLDRAVECSDSDLAWRLIEAGHRNVFVDNLWIYHEIESQSAFRWFLEPTRLFILPELVRRHPQLRERLLANRLFFYRGSIPYYAAAVLGVAVAFIDWRLLLVVPVLILIRTFRRAERNTPRAWARAGTEVLLNVARNYVLCLTLLYGSVRFRTLVL